MSSDSPTRCYCTKCGTEVAESSSYCGQCGAMVAQGVVPPVNTASQSGQALSVQSTPSATRRPLLIASISSSIVAILAFAYFTLPMPLGLGPALPMAPAATPIVYSYDNPGIDGTMSLTKVPGCPSDIATNCSLQDHYQITIDTVNTSSHHVCTMTGVERPHTRSTDHESVQTQFQLGEGELLTVVKVLLAGNSVQVDCEENCYAYCGANADFVGRWSASPVEVANQETPAETGQQSIDLVKQSILLFDKSVTVGDAIEGYSWFSESHWEFRTTTQNRKVVVATAKIDSPQFLKEETQSWAAFSDKRLTFGTVLQAEIEFQFVLHKHEESFEIGQIALRETFSSGDTYTFPFPVSASNALLQRVWANEPVSSVSLLFIRIGWVDSMTP